LLGIADRMTLRFDVSIFLVGKRRFRFLLRMERACKRAWGVILFAPQRTILRAQLILDESARRNVRWNICYT